MKLKNKLKKICGEKLAQFLSRNFNQNTIIEVIEDKFNNNGHDIRHIKEHEFDILKKLLNVTLEDKSEEESEVSNISATELLKNNGYELIRVKSNKEAQNFVKYFRDNEKLCKFSSTGVYKNTDVYFIVKEDAENIRPSDNPNRQDEYSTSVMSTKISKDGRHVLQITSRYNHTVSGCDNTYNSNLDNIVDGLSEAFNFEFGYSIKKRKADYEFENFCEVGNVYVYYHREISGIKIGDNTLVTDKIVNFSKDRYYTYDYFIIDLKDKKIVWDDYFECNDGFVEYFNDTVEKIEFVKDIDSVDDGGLDTICYIQK